MGSFNHIDDVHKLTLYQISYLAAHSKRFSFVFKVKEQPSAQTVKSHSFTFTQKRFEGVLRESIEREGLSKVFVCGPPGMNHTMLKLLSERIPKNQYVIY
jgi:NAD(P)H-flavin reductase